MGIQSALEELTSVDHRATALLRREHEAILGAFREYRDTPPAGRKPVGQQIVMLIEIHDRVERTVVYPSLAPYYGPLIRAFLTEHDQVSACIAFRVIAQHDLTGAHAFSGDARIGLQAHAKVGSGAAGIACRGAPERSAEARLHFR